MKKLLSVLVACVMIASLAISASAFDLGPFNAINQPTQKGWLTDGTDDKASDLKIATLVGAKYLILELSKVPEGEGIQMVWQGDGNSWAWTQKDLKVADFLQGTTLVFPLADVFLRYDEFKASTQVKFYVCYYDKNMDDLGVVKAYLSDTVPEAGAAAAPVEAPAETPAEVPAESVVEAAPVIEAAPVAEAVVEAPVTRPAEGAAVVNAVATDDKGVDAGVASVAVIAGLALIAASGAVVARKRK